MNGCGSFRLGYVSAGFGGNCDCRYGISCVGLVILASSPYSSDLLVPGGGWSASGVLLCVRVCRPHAFGFYGSGLLLFFLSFLDVWVLVLGVCVVFFLLCCTLELVSYY